MCSFRGRIIDGVDGSVVALTMKLNIFKNSTAKS